MWGTRKQKMSASTHLALTEAPFRPSHALVTTAARAALLHRMPTPHVRI